MSRKQQWTLSVLAAAGLGAAAAGDIINVPGDFPTIQVAIDAAQDGDEVVVAAGTYLGEIDFSGKAITVRSVSGPDMTVIEATGTVVTFVSLESSDSVLDGFTISGGTATEGGGMLIEFSDPTVTNCIFDGNSATRGAGAFLVGSTAAFANSTFTNNDAAELGGGVYCNASSPVFMGCTFASNGAIQGNASHGGAIYNTGFSNSIVIECTFQSNSAEGDGGAIGTTAFSDITFEACLFDGNTADSGGAVYSDSSSPTFTNCTMCDNVGRFRAGAVYTVNGSGPSFTGCTFEANQAGASAQCCPDVQGGAIYSTGGSLILADCVLIGNEVLPTPFGSNSTGWGGAVYTNATDVTVTGSVFESNIADAGTFAGSSRGLGGALFLDTGVAAITTSVFLSNEARAGSSDGSPRGLGGAIYTTAAVDLEGSLFQDNIADNGSGSGITRALGGAVYSSTDATLRGCTFNSNGADANGGGIYHTGGSNSQLMVVESSFIANMAVLGSSIFNTGAAEGSRIISCRFLGNITGVSGGIYNDNSNPDVFNCIFSGNSASSFGGGIFNFDDSDPLIVNCTFTGNEAFAGAAVHNFSNNSSASVHNSIAWNNVNANGTDLDGVGVHTVTFSNIEGGMAGTGNIDADPLFVDPDGPDDIAGTDDDNLRLLTSSPSIDAGDNGVLPQDSADLDGDTNTDEVIPFDLDGNDRIIDGDGDKSAIVDMGAYEAALPTCPWDVDGSGDVGVTDFLALLSAWGPNRGHPADFDGDGAIGVPDFLELLANWGPCP